jgi:regulator of protease activity HflC (stomatin/prohibitin superfamily)
MKSQSNPGCLIALLIGAVVVLVVGFFASTARVGSNEVGIVNNAGSIDRKQIPLQPGWHLITPFTQGVDTVSTVQQSHPFSKVETAAHNQQTIYVEGTVSYHVDTNKAATLVIQGGPNQIINRILWPAFQDFIKEETPKFDDYSSVLNNRPKIRTDVTSALQGKTDQFGLFVDDIYLTNIYPEKSYADAINNAAKAQQDLATATNEAKAKVASAQGDADANRIRQQTITDAVLQQQALNNQAAMINKWDGHLPQYMLGGNTNPLMIISGGVPTK